MNDLRFAFRQLLKHSGFTTMAVLTLALGIGANTGMFSVIQAVLLKSLPYVNPERLALVCESNLKRGIPQVVVAPGNLRDWSEQNSTCETIGGQLYTSFTLSSGDKPEHLHAAYTTPNYFSVFGVAPVLGRTFVADDKPPGHRVAVLSHGLWQRSFGGDRAIIGRKITLSEMVYTVIGVMPADFKVYHPTVFGLPTGNVQPQLWAPYPGSMDERAAKYFLTFARLKSGVTATQAQNDLNAILERAKREFTLLKDAGVTVRPLAEQVVGSSRPALLLLLGAVAFVLLIACANVANLSLARSAARSKEFAIRSALGAARGRLIRQLLIESVILALIAGGLGVALAYGGLAGLAALRPANLLRLDEVQLDGSVLVFTMVISLATGLLFGLVPALQASRPDLVTSLKEGGRAGGGVGRQRVRRFLVVSEVALATILLTGAGLLINSFARLLHVDPGFQPEQLLSFDVSPGWQTYADDAKRMNLVRQLRERVQSLAGVSSAATVYGLPFGTMLNSLVAVNIAQDPTADTLGDSARAGWRVISPNYFQTMGASLLAGRAFSEQLDSAGTAPVAIINEAFQQKYFSTEPPVGRRIKPFTVSSNWHEIVGVIRDVKLTGLNGASAPELYQVDTQQAPWMFSLVVRSTMPPAQIEKLVRLEAAALDKGLPLFNVRTMEKAIGTSVAPRRFSVILIGLFAALALTLTAVGIYSVVAYTVSQQTRDIGIRMALGASRWTVVRWVLQQGVSFALFGIGIGLAGSLGLARLIANQLFGVSAHDPSTVALVAALLLLVALAACYLPARRAMRIDPMEALRYE